MARLDRIRPQSKRKAINAANFVARYLDQWAAADDVHRAGEAIRKIDHWIARVPDRSARKQVIMDAYFRGSIGMKGAEQFIRDYGLEED